MSRGGRFALGDEDRLTRDDAKHVVRRLRHLLRPWRGRIVIATLTLVGQAGCILAGPALLKHGIDSGLLEHDSGALDLSAALFLVAAFGAFVFGRLSTFQMARIGETFLRNIRVRVFRHLLDLGLDFFEREKTGRLVARMTSDVDAMQELVQMGLTAFVMNIMLFTGAVLLVARLLGTIDAMERSNDDRCTAQS